MSDTSPVWALLLAGTLVGPSSVFAQTQDVALALKPASKWHVSYDKDGCRLARVFGEDDSPTSLILAKFYPGDAFRLTVGGRAFRPYMKADRAYVQFGPTEARQDVNYFAGELGNSVPAMIFRGTLNVAGPTAEQEQLLKQSTWNSPFRVPPIATERKAAVTYLSISRSVGKAIRLETGPLKAPLAALDKCVDNLLTTWGIDVARHATLSRIVAPRESPGNWVTDNDYPTGPLMRGQQGVVNFRLSVDSSGAVTACNIQQSTRPAEFDEAVCKALTRRAKFHPALDAQGNTMASYYPGTFVFMMDR